MIRPLLLLGALLLPLSAMAQSETRLRVSESGSVTVQPDELVASLRVEVRADTAAEARERVNRAMAAALAAARAAPDARPMMMAARPTPPSVTAEAITVTARVTADLLLRR